LAHPKLGPFLATTSFDNSVLSRDQIKVWQRKDQGSFEEWFCYSAWESSSSLD